MPQMAPLSWFILMMLFLSLYLLNTIKVYFTNSYSLSSSAPISKIENNFFNWKW